ILATYAPRIHESTSTKLAALFKRYGLCPNFPNSIYPAASFNFGPATVCFDHTDTMNDPCNWCHIVALGSYNPDSGGDIILFNIKHVVRFPPGSSVLIPSAIMRHGNVAIAAHERRMSFTQYCAGGLLRWVECGFRTLGEFARDNPLGKAAYEAGLAERVQRCVQQFSTV
ncbi:hypothetical protein OH77DRAFT_1372086, partial [Trametes cingulata]